MKAETNIVAFVGVQSWAGYSRHRVLILAETATRYRVRYEDPSTLPTRLRARGAVQTVPKWAVVIGSPPSNE